MVVGMAVFVARGVFVGRGVTGALVGMKHLVSEKR